MAGLAITLLSEINYVTKHIIINTLDFEKLEVMWKSLKKAPRLEHVGMTQENFIVLSAIQQ